MRRRAVALVLARIVCLTALEHNEIVVLEAEVTFSRSSAVRLDTPQAGAGAGAAPSSFLARFWAWEAQNSRQFQHWYKMLYRDGPRSLLFSLRWGGDEGVLPLKSSGVIFWLELVVNPYVRLLRLAIAAADPSTCVAARAAAALLCLVPPRETRSRG